MARTPLPPATRPAAPTPSLRTSLYRYWFYGWLFRDADSGSPMERAIALRHNRQQARWLPTYMRRWAVGGGAIGALEGLSERLTGDSPLSAALEVALMFVVLFELVTVVSWAFLHDRRPSA
jgi:hypothetical protein